MKVNIMSERYDTSISEEQLLSLSAEDITWFWKELGLSPKDLYRICKRADEITQECKLRDDEILDLTYDTGGGWYINFEHSVHTAGCWKFSVYRKDQAATTAKAAE